MIGRINSKSLVTLLNSFFADEKVKVNDEHLILRIFQNSGNREYVPPEVTDQNRTDANDLSAIIKLLPGLELPLNEIRLSSSLAKILPHSKALCSEIASMLPNDEMRKIELFENETDERLEDLRGLIGAAYVYKIALIVGTDLKIKAMTTDEIDMATGQNMMNICKILGAVAFNFPDRIKAGADDYHQMASAMLQELPAVSDNKYSQTLEDCNVWTAAQEKQIREYRAMSFREKVDAISHNPINIVDIKLVLASAKDSKEIDALHKKFKKVNAAYGEKTHGPLFENAKLMIGPKISPTGSEPASTVSKGKPSRSRRFSLSSNSTGRMTSKMSKNSGSSSRSSLKNLHDSRKGFKNDPYAAEKNGESAFPDIPQYDEHKKPEGLKASSDDLNRPKKESAEAFPGINQYDADKRPDGLDSDKKEQDSGHRSPRMGRSSEGSGDN